MTALDAAVEVLRRVGTPLHVNKITDLMLDLGLWMTNGKTPWSTVNARIATEIIRKGSQSQFVRIRPGVYDLQERSLAAAPLDSKPTAPAVAKLTFADAAERVLRQNDGQEPLHYKEIARRIMELGLVETKAATPASTLNAGIGHDILSRRVANERQRFVRLGRGLIGLAGLGTERGPAAEEARYSFPDAAERILRQNDGQGPLHYKEIVRRMLDLKLVETRAVIPAYTLSAAISHEIRCRQEGHRPQRFVRLGHGLIGLANAGPAGVRKAIDDQNELVRNDLKKLLWSTDPVEFEHLVKELFSAMGAEWVKVTRRNGGGGVDVRGMLLVGRAIPIKIGARVLRLKHSVDGPVVNETRGDLDPHDIGLVVTLGSFSPEAKKAATIKGRKPITLIDGDELVNLMVEHEIWVNRQQHDLLTLATPSPDRTKGSE